MAGQNIIAAASLAPKILSSGQIAATTATTVYTAPGTGSAIVKHGTACNISGSQAATLSGLLSTGAPITALPVNATTQALATGATVTVTSGANTQTWTLTAPAAVGATSLAVTSQTPNFAYPSGSVVAVTAQTVVFSLSVHPSGSTIDGTHRVVSAYSLVAGDTLPLGDYIGGCNLGPGDFVVALASVANILDVVLTGVEST